MQAEAVSLGRLEVRPMSKLSYCEPCVSQMGTVALGPLCPWSAGARGLLRSQPQHQVSVDTPCRCSQFSEQFCMVLGPCYSVMEPSGHPQVY